MDWRERYPEKVMTADEAVKMVRSGDRVVIGMMYQTPLELCRALVRRSQELHDVEIENTISTFGDWWQGEARSAFKVRTCFITVTDRSALKAGLLDYVVPGPTRQDESYWTERPVDVFMTQLSPPDEQGFCSFGMCIWGARQVAQAARCILAEVNERFIRTGGENYVHVSQIDALVPCGPDWRMLRPPERTPEETDVTEVICSLVAHEIVQDRDTVQVGTGTVSAALPAYLGHRRELGMHTELIFSGVPQLVEQGIITGQHKTLHQGKVVGTSFGPLRDDELRLVDGHPAFELYDMSYTNDIRTIMAHDNLVAVNNALLVDVTGQVTAESLGPQIYSGIGGAFAFAVGAAHARNGRSVTVLPSTAVVDGQRHSRILPVLAAGTAVTVPRNYADIFVTEYGIARLRGKTLRQRVEEMVSIAHPDFRSELRREAKRLLNL